MPTKIPIKSSNRSKQKIPQTYDHTGNTIEFYISEQTATYEKERPFTVYYDDPAHFVRRLKGDCIERH